MELQYLEIHQKNYEDVCQNLGREPTWAELEYSYRNDMISMIDFYRDFVRLNGNMSILKK